MNITIKLPKLKPPSLLQTSKAAFITIAFCEAFHGIGLADKMAEDNISAAYANLHNKLISSIATSNNLAPRPEPLALQSALVMADKEARRQHVDPFLVRAVLVYESTNNQDAESPVGARGLMQVMPVNAKHCGYKHADELFEPSKNIYCGVKLLKENLEQYNHDAFKAVEAYNGGPKCVGICKDSINEAKAVLVIMHNHTDDKFMTAEDKRELNEELEKIS